MQKKIAILCGGKSTEHEVSLMSAKNIIETIDKEKYEIILIGIHKTGEWFLQDINNFLSNEEDPKNISLINSDIEVGLVLGKKDKQLISLKDGKVISSIDVAFPVLHGSYGEDGSVQGLLKLANIPFVGPSVLGSSVGMDKDCAKRLLRDAGIPVADFLTFNFSEIKKISFEEIENDLGLPFFVKPANLGSSVGISKVKNKAEFQEAINNAFQYDNKILIEKYIKGRELECALLGNEVVRASEIGEIVVSDFYSYEAKYLDDSGVKLIFPADISEFNKKRIQEMAIDVFKVLGCEGMGRVDFFLTEVDELIVNEINTIPGFTKISMYPKLWELSGISYTDLISELIELALERFARENKLKTNF